VALQRWAQHVADHEGSMWRAAGLLVAGGCCRQALHLLQSAGLPDSAAAFLGACHAAGLTSTTLPKPNITATSAGAASDGPLSSRPSVDSNRRLSMSRGEILLQQQASIKRRTCVGRLKAD
jgi:hypothetical protein